MASPDDAKLWYWRDYNRGYLDQHQILATDSWSQFMIAFVAVCLTLAGPYIFRIGKSFVFWVLSMFDELRATSSHKRPGERQSLLPPREQSTISYGSLSALPPAGSLPMLKRSGPRDTIREILAKSGSSRDTAWALAQNIVRNGAESYASPAISMVMITTILFGLFVAWTTAGIFSARIASDRAALSSSKYCGIWRFDIDAGDEAADIDDLHNYRKESLAGQYARNCYNSDDPIKALGCTYFYNQSIAFDTKNHQVCPFESSELCLNGLYSAVTFDTGYVDASVIGINSAITHKFRRKTSCSALNMTDLYVRKDTFNSSVYHYYYGPTEIANHTFQTSGDPFQWRVPVYSVNAYYSSLYPNEDYWQPLPGLRQASGSTLTIIFVSSMHIYHVEPSFDPVFHATMPQKFEGIRKPFYYNSDPRARPIACVDTTELCSPDGSKCWSMTAPLPPDIPRTAAYWLMKWSLESSTIYQSLSFRLGTALLAQEYVSQFVSRPLSSDHWEAEVSQLFATSLARIQYDAWNIASGEDRARPGYVERTPDEAKGRLCGMYKFKSVAYTNVNLLGLIFLPLTALIIRLLCLEVKSASQLGDTSASTGTPSTGLENTVGTKDSRADRSTAHFNFTSNTVENPPNTLTTDDAAINALRSQSDDSTVEEDAGLSEPEISITKIAQDDTRRALVASGHRDAANIDNFHTKSSDTATSHDSYAANSPTQGNASDVGADTNTINPTHPESQPGISTGIGAPQVSQERVCRKCAECDKCSSTNQNEHKDTEEILPPIMVIDVIVKHIVNLILWILVGLFWNFPRRICGWCVKCKKPSRRGTARNSSYRSSSSSNPRVEV